MKLSQITQPFCADRNEELVFHTVTFYWSTDGKGKTEPELAEVNEITERIKLILSTVTFSA